MRSILRFPWAVAAAVLLATPAFASSTIFACFGGGTVTTDPQVACPGTIKGSEIDAISFQGSDLVSFLAAGGVSTSQLNFSDISLSKVQDHASDSLLADVYAGKKLGVVAIALYGDGPGGSGSPAPSFNILLSNAYVTSWQVSAAAGSPLTESVTLSFTSIVIVDNTTGQKVFWTQ
ncbi:MAG TPA: type VI secretion system tube protein Hcp [Terracidiphilus sp.]|jgi:type VI protein secretion system component Hcp